MCCAYTPRNGSTKHAMRTHTSSTHKLFTVFCPVCPAESCLWAALVPWQHWQARGAEEVDHVSKGESHDNHVTSNGVRVRYTSLYVFVVCALCVWIGKMGGWWIQPSHCRTVGPSELEVLPPSSPVHWWHWLINVSLTTPLTALLCVDRQLHPCMDAFIVL